MSNKIKTKQHIIKYLYVVYIKIQDVHTVKLLTSFNYSKSYWFHLNPFKRISRAELLGTSAAGESCVLYLAAFLKNTQ